MVLETAQLLCGAYYYTGQEDISPYKLAHENHPCSKWSRESLSNWLWLRQFGIALYDEYKFRYNKIHKSGEIILSLTTPNLVDIGITTRPQCMPDQYKNIDPVIAYRNYYINEKTKMLKYKNRDKPFWIGGKQIMKSCDTKPYKLNENFSEEEINKKFPNQFYYSIMEGGLISNDGSIILITDRQPYINQTMSYRPDKQEEYASWIEKLTSIGMISE
jgi:hypothetical protein